MLYISFQKNKEGFIYKKYYLMDITNSKSSSLSIGIWILLILIPILMRGCYWYVGIPYIIEKVGLLVTAFLLIVFFFVQIYSKRIPKDSYGSLIKYIVLLSFISIINAFVFWGQSPYLTFSAGGAIYLYIYYFVLKKVDVGYDNIIKLIFVFSAITAICWVYAFYNAPGVVFGNAEEIKDDRGMFRISVGGQDMVYLCYFYSLTKMLSNKRDLKYIASTIISFLLVFATLSRMTIFAVLLVTVFYVLRKKSIIIIILVSIVALFSYNKIVENEIVSNLIELQKAQMEDPDSDKLIRSENIDSFRLFPFHIGTFLFGNGTPHSTSAYGIREEGLKDRYLFNRSDAALAGYYLNYGIVSLIIIILLLYRIIRRKIPEEYYFCKLYVIYFVVTSITTYSFEASALALMVVAYTLDLINKEHIILEPQKEATEIRKKTIPTNV